MAIGFKFIGFKFGRVGWKVREIDNVGFQGHRGNNNEI